MTLLSVVRCLYLILAILTWLAAGGDDYDHRFHAQCCNLDTALEQAHNHTSNTSVYISLSAGTFTLSSNQLATFYNWIKLAIVGVNMSDSIVHCDHGVGFTFLESTDIVLRNVSLSGCGANHNSTSRDPTTKGQEVKYLEFLSAVYFLGCADITVEDVNVTDSLGTGLVVYNSARTNKFIRCKFCNNPVREGEHGGGGVVIEFSHCTPGNITCTNTASSVQVVSSTYHFSKCEFENNIASAGKLTRESTGSGTSHMGFGKGGALAIHFKGRSKNNSVLLEDCSIYGNGASWSGGGLYLGFGDESSNNSVHMYGSSHFNVITMNSYYPDPLSSGGGARIEFISTPQLWSGHTSKVVNNSVVFNGTQFIGNIANVGGGVSVAASREPSGQDATNSLVFDSCVFNNNLALVGFAVGLSLHHPDVITTNGAVMEPLFRNCKINSNQQNVSNLTHYDDSYGAFYTNLVPVRFEGVTNLSSNPGTAMVVSGTYVSLMNSSSMMFSGNSGRHGGALSFIGSAWLVAYHATELTFVNNSVGMDGLGGAIYAVHFNEPDVLNTQNCFFKYYNSLEDSSEWKTRLTFTGNTAKFKTNSIYVSSALSCERSQPNSTDSLSGAFCHSPWIFQDDESACSSQVSTGPSKMNISKFNMSVVPGWDNSVGIHIHNDYDMMIPAVYMAAPRNKTDMDVIGVSNKTEYIADDNLIVFGKPNERAQLLFTTLEPRVISSVMEVDVLSCPPGFRPISCTHDPDMVCDCKCANPGPGVTCNNQSHNASLLSYYCLTHRFDGNDIINNSQLIYGECPYNQKRLHLHDTLNLEERVCGPSNRNGTLCSKCQPGYGVDINSYNFKCIRCNEKIGWLLYLVLEILPITFFFMLIAILNISATSAPMNAFVFFSQITSVPYFRNPYPFFYSPVFLENDWLQTSVLLPYALWNLDFFRTNLFPGVCVSTRITTIEALALNYIKAFYPMLLILVCYVLIQLYDRNFRVVHCLWKPFRWCLKRLHKRHEPKTSIIDAFATFLLLSYTKFMFVSFPLLTPLTLHDGRSPQATSLHQVVFYFDASVEFRGKFFVLAVIAGIIFAIFVVLPPLLLMAYPWRIFQKCIGRLPFRIAIKTFADAFQGDFRDGVDQGMDCRFFSGLYFLFRIAIFIIFILQLELAKQYLIQQVLFICCMMLFTMVKPYKDEFYNKLDISFFFLLSLMNALSFYSSQIDENHGTTSIPAFVINYILGVLPMFYVAGMVGYLVLIWMGCLKKNVISKPSEDFVIVGDTDSDMENSTEPMTYVYNPHSKSEEDIPDRLLNPQNYASRNMYKPLNTDRSSSGSRSQGAASKGIKSEGSYFLDQEARREFHPAYGSTSVTEPALRVKGHTQLKDFTDE